MAMCSTAFSNFILTATGLLNCDRGISQLQKAIFLPFSILTNFEFFSVLNTNTNSFDQDQVRHNIVSDFDTLLVFLKDF